MGDSEENLTEIEDIDSTYQADDSKIEVLDAINVQENLDPDEVPKYTETHDNFMAFNAPLSAGDLFDDHDEPLEKSQLTVLMSRVCYSILDDAVCLLSIQGKTIGIPNVRVDISNPPQHERCQNLPSHDTLFDPETMAPVKTSEDKFMRKKLQADRSMAQQVLESTMLNLSEEDNYHFLSNFVKKYKTNLEDDLELQNAVERKQKIELDLHYGIQNGKKIHQNLLHKVDSTLRETVADLQKCLSVNEVHTAYVENWEQSRQQQHKRVLNEKVKKWSSVISTHKTKMQEEIQAHNEITQFLDENTEDIQTDIQNWMDRYEIDLEKTESKIAAAGVGLENLTKDVDALKEELKKRDREVEEFLAYKEQQRLLKERIKKETQAACKIQRWWRNVMIRKKLGPYSKKAKRKNKGKKGKTKKK